MLPLFELTAAPWGCLRTSGGCGEFGVRGPLRPETWIKYLEDLEGD